MVSATFLRLEMQLYSVSNVKIHYYCSQTKLWEGNVFLSVILSMGGGVYPKMNLGRGGIPGGTEAAVVYPSTHLGGGVDRGCTLAPKPEYATGVRYTHPTENTFLYYAAVQSST